MPIRQRLAASYRAAAGRGRRLLTRATTPRLREHLGAKIARCGSIAEEIESAPEPDPKSGKDREVPMISRTPYPDEPSEASAARRKTR